MQRTIAIVAAALFVGMTLVPTGVADPEVNSGGVQCTWDIEVPVPTGEPTAEVDCWDRCPEDGLESIIPWEPCVRQ